MVRALGFQPKDRGSIPLSRSTLKEENTMSGLLSQTDLLILKEWATEVVQQVKELFNGPDVYPVESYA